MLRSRFLLTAALLGALGCQAETFGDDDLAIDPAAPWVVEGPRFAGARLVLSAPWMSGLLDSATIQIDDRPVTRIGRPTGRGDAFEIPLPAELPAGRHTIRLQVGGTVVDGRVATGGFLANRSVPSDVFGGRVQQLGSSPALFGVVGISWTPTVLDLRAGTVRSPDGLPHAHPYGVGSAPEPNTFILSGSGYNHFRVGSGIQGWRYDLVPVVTTGERAAALGRGLYLVQANAMSFLRSFPSDSVWWYSDMPGYLTTDIVAYSPDGRWSVPDHVRSSRGVLVFDQTDKSIRWIAGWERARTLFTDDGTLIVFGGDWQDPSTHRLARIDVTTGVELGSVPMDLGRTALEVPALVDGGRLLALATLRGRSFEILLFDPTTLVEVARARSPLLATECLFRNETRIVDDPIQHSAYVTVPDCYDGGGIPIATFQFPE